MTDPDSNLALTLVTDPEIGLAMPMTSGGPPPPKPANSHSTAGVRYDPDELVNLLVTITLKARAR